MFKGIKVFFQVASIWTPILIWNYNTETIDTETGVLFTCVGIVFAILVQWIYNFVNYLFK